MDFVTLIGVLGGFTLIITAILMGGDPGNFIDIPSIMIVFGGVISASLITFPLEEVLGSLKSAVMMFVSKKINMGDVVETMVRIADISRRNGIIALQNVQTNNAVLRKACQLIADNASPDIIKDMLHIEIMAMKRRHNVSITVFTKLAGYGPAFGMIGTLIGLVQMLTNLSDPKMIGPAMAVAILTTFYGAVLAYLIFIPIAGKMKARSMQEELILFIVFEGARCILDNNNPRLVFEKLSSFIPPKERKNER